MTNAEMGTVQCRNCRAICDSSFHFCGRCGQRLGRGRSPLAVDPMPTSSRPAVQSENPRRRQGRIYGVTIVILCLLLLSGSLWAVASIPAAAQPTTSMAKVRTLRSASGVAWFYDLRAQSDGFALHLANLPMLVKGKVYVGWLLNIHRPDQMLATGPLAVASDGSSTFLSEQFSMFNSAKLDLRLLFTQVMVTIERAGMLPMQPEGRVLLSGTIDQSAVTDTLPLFVSASYTPRHIALLSGLRSQMRELGRWIANMQVSQQQQDSNAVQADLLRIIYIIEGIHGSDVQSLKILALSNIQNEGDGFGLIAPANCQPAIHPCGYLSALQATLQPLIKDHALDMSNAQNIQVALATMSQLASAMQQRAVQLTRRLAHLTTFNAAINQSLLQLEMLSDALLNGRDLNGDGSIDPVPGEAAAAQLYAYLQQASSIPLSMQATLAQ